MQDQIEKQLTAPAGELPPEVVAGILKADVLILVTQDQAGQITVQPTVIGGEYRPETNAAHAFLAAVQSEHSYLCDIVYGRINDADRYRALRDFAALAGSNPERFETVNVALQAFEESNGLGGDSTKRTEEDFTKIADFLVLALAETAEAGPVVLAGTNTQQ